MVKVLSILFFDASTGKWGRAKPQKSPPTPSQTTFTAAVVQFAADEGMPESVAAARAKPLSEALRPRMPSVIALNGVPPAFANALLAQDWVRSTYAVSEVAPHSMLLWQIGLPVQVAECNDRPQFTGIILRKFFGSDCVIMAANTDEAASVETRVAEAHQLLGRSAPDATTMLLFNPFNVAAKDKALAASFADKLGQVRVSAGFAEDVAAPDAGPTVWVRASNLMITGVAPMPIAGEAVKSCVLATLVPRVGQALTSPADAAAAAEKAMPTPGSAKGEGSVTAVFPSSPNSEPPAYKKRTWSIKHSSAIRVRDGTDEVHYDLTPYFPKADDAVRALSAGAFAWPVDYCVLHGRLLAVHGQNADIPAFRQYMNHHAPPPKPEMRGVHGANPNAVARDKDAGAVGDKRRGKDPSNFSPYCLTTPTLGASRRRTWSAHRAILLYQVSPREMKFDITKVIGTGVGKLNEAVARLNGHRVAKQAGVAIGPTNAGGVAVGGEDAAANGESGGAPEPEDPLRSYRHDYALVYASDRAGYWLLAAMDVPCDVAPCRVAAKYLQMPVATALLQGGDGAGM